MKVVVINLADTLININTVAFVSGYLSRFSGSTFEFMFTIHMPYNLYSKVLSTKLSLMKSDYVYSDFHFLSLRI